MEYYKAIGRLRRKHNQIAVKIHALHDSDNKIPEVNLAEYERLTQKTRCIAYALTILEDV